jgi:deferrochelatase/peroxidase EfeB
LTWLIFLLDFGYLDGIAQPAIAGFNTQVQNGQSLILPGIILLGEPGDQFARPAWAKDGSFLVFRQLAQLVPEFDKFLTDNPIQDPTGAVSLTPAQGSELLGARMIGRWKSVCAFS